MTRIPVLALLFVFVTLLLAGCGGGGDTPASISAEIGANMKAMAEVLNSITDEASAKAAVPRIEAIRADMRDVAARAKALPPMDAEEMAAAEAAAQANAGEAMESLMEANMKLVEVMAEHPEIQAILEPALAGIENDM